MSERSASVAAVIKAGPEQPQVVYRVSGNDGLLVEYGEIVLDLNIRMRVHALELAIEQAEIPGIVETCPGVRSLLILFDGSSLSLAKLLDALQSIEKDLNASIPEKVASRIVRLPIAFNESAVRAALDKYMQGVRAEGPYLPVNIEFVARANGLSGTEEVMQFMLDSPYLVLGLGDVYLGAPCATAYDPRKRMVVPKFNPARIWTAEGTVGLGGAFLCIYPMNSPGGYQLVGRTLPIWNTFQTNSAFKDGPWLLRNFDKIEFTKVEEAELNELRDKATDPEFAWDITDDVFDIKAYNAFLKSIESEVEAFNAQQREAIDKAIVGY